MMIGNNSWKKIFPILFFCLSLLAIHPVVAQNRDRLKIHVVQAKETVYSLARRYGLTEEDIYTLNPSAKDGIQIGQSLLIPAKTLESKLSTAGNPAEHIIRPQETLYSVSRLYSLSEEELKQANPGISASNFPAGYKLRIPNGISSSVTSSAVAANAVEVGLLLPLSSTHRYMEFYEGMLMGLNGLKKKGVSVNLHVYDVSDVSATEAVIRSGELNDCHLIIGGASNDQINVLSRFSDKRGINYVVPFSSGNIAGNASATLFQINPPQDFLYPLVAKAFMRRYADRNIVFVTDDKEVEACASYLMSALNKAGISYTKISFQTEQSDLVQLLKANTRKVIVPCSSKKQALSRLLSLVGGNSNPDLITFFGYPEWQSFGRDMKSRMKKYTTSFYSSFFFHPEHPDSEKFLSQYYAWYNHKVAGSFPKYSVLGYDITNYFIGGLFLYPSSLKDNLTKLSSVGLQTNFQFREIKRGNGYVNLNLFFVTLYPDGRVERMPL